MLYSVHVNKAQQQKPLQNCQKKRKYLLFYCAFCIMERKD